MKSFSKYIIVFIVLFSFYILINFSYLIFWYGERLISLLDTFYFNTQIKDFIFSNIKTILGWVFLYIIFLWYLKNKKWLIALENNVHSQYFYTLATLYWTINIVIPFYLLYLFWHWIEFFTTLLVISLVYLTWIILKEFTLLRNNYLDLNKINSINHDIDNLKKEMNNHFQLIIKEYDKNEIIKFIGFREIFKQDNVNINYIENGVFKSTHIAKQIFYS